MSHDAGVPRATRLPEIEIHDQGVGFELAGPGEALVQLANAFSQALRIEVTPDDGSVVIVRLTDGPVILSHNGTTVEIVGGREQLDELAETLRFVAAGPTTPSAVLPRARRALSRASMAGGRKRTSRDHTV
jgi:hypothetical protein